MRPVHIMLALLVVVLWGVNFVFIDIGLRDWPPMLLAAARFTFVVIPAIVFVRFPRGSFGRILLIGVFMTAGQFALLYTAMSLGLPAGLASTRHPDPGCLHRHRRRPRPPRGSAPPAGAGHRHRSVRTRRQSG